MLKIRRSGDRLIFLTWESPYLGKTIFILKQGPACFTLCCRRSGRWWSPRRRGGHSSPQGPQEGPTSILRQVRPHLQEPHQPGEAHEAAWDPQVPGVPHVSEEVPAPRGAHAPHAHGALHHHLHLYHLQHKLHGSLRLQEAHDWPAQGDAPLPLSVPRLSVQHGPPVHSQQAFPHPHGREELHLQEVRQRIRSVWRTTYAHPRWVERAGDSRPCLNTVKSLI